MKKQIQIIRVAHFALSTSLAFEMISSLIVAIFSTAIFFSAFELVPYPKFGVLVSLKLLSRLDLRVSLDFYAFCFYSAKYSSTSFNCFNYSNLNFTLSGEYSFTASKNVSNCHLSISVFLISKISA